MDHLGRFISRCQKAELVSTVKTDTELSELANQLASILGSQLEESHQNSKPKELKKFCHHLEDQFKPYRKEVISQLAQGQDSTENTLARLDAFRWLRSISYHAWRIQHHLNKQKIIGIKNY